MVSINDLKSKFQALLRPIVGKLAAIGVTANQVTVLAMLLSFAVGGVIFLYPNDASVLLLVPIALFVRMALNLIY